MSVQSSGASIAAPHPTIANLWVRETDSQSGLILTGYCHGAFTDTTAGTYEHGAMIVQTDAASGLTIFVNSGTTALPVWTQIGNLPPGDIALTDTHILVGNGSNVAVDVSMKGDATLSDTGTLTVASGAITGGKLSTLAGYYAVAVKTNGTTPVNVFGATNGFAGTITSVTSIAQDATASFITMATNAANVATNIVKGTAIGGVAGTVMSATAFTAGGTLTVVSSGSGNSIVVATFTVA